MTLLKKLSSAFTMAEILIALTVIGVIATLTLPSLSGNINSQQFSVTFRKTLSAINQGVDINSTETGVDFSGSSDVTTEQAFDQIFINRLGARRDRTSVWNISGISQFSGFSVSDGFTLNSNASAVDGGAAFDSSSSFSTSLNYANQLIYTMKDGLASVIIFAGDNFNCNDEGEFSTFDNHYARHYCLGYIDVNGPKGPNTIVTCANANHNTGSSTATSTNNQLTTNFNSEACVVNSNMVTDVYPVLFYGNHVVPATRAALAVFQDKLSTAQ